MNRSLVFSWSNVTNKLGRWTRLGRDNVDNALVEQPKEEPAAQADGAAPKQPPREGLVQVEENQSIFDRVRQPRATPPQPPTRWGKGGPKTVCLHLNS